MHEQRKNFRVHFNKVLKDKKDTKVQLEYTEDTKVWRPTRHEDTKKQEKLKRHVVLKAGLLNAEGIARPEKREELARKWEEAKLDISLMPETQHNSVGCEQFPAWGKYIIFYSSSIEPDTKAKEEAKRVSIQKIEPEPGPPSGRQAMKVLALL